jgi:hypothetical protein
MRGFFGFKANWYTKLYFEKIRKHKIHLFKHVLKQVTFLKYLGNYTIFC